MIGRQSFLKIQLIDTTELGIYRTRMEIQVPIYPGQSASDLLNQGIRRAVDTELSNIWKPLISQEKAQEWQRSLLVIATQPCQTGQKDCRCVICIARAALSEKPLTADQAAALDGASIATGLPGLSLQPESELARPAPPEPGAYPPGWPECPACGEPALDGHITCGKAQCDESSHRSHQYKR